MTRASGTEGYAEEAEALLVQYESLAFEHVQRWTLPLIPAGALPYPRNRRGHRA